VQSVVNAPASSTSSASGTLRAFSSSKNFVIGFVCNKITTANITAPINGIEINTEIVEINVSPTGSLECAYLNYEEDSCTWTQTNSLSANFLCELAGNDTDDAVAGSTGTIVQYQV
jgi:hypothetical protein